jgi:ribosomal protein S18 acetylase RimI-like enzyme
VQCGATLNPVDGLAIVKVATAMRDSVIAKRPNVADYFDRRMAAISSGAAAWFAAIDGSREVIGWVVLNWASGARDASVEDLWVADAHRRRGIGTALMHELERRARESHEATLWLAVNATENEPAARLYERLGFSYDGGPPYLDGVYDGHEDWVVDMHKTL